MQSKDDGENMTNHTPSTEEREKQLNALRFMFRGHLGGLRKSLAANVDDDLKDRCFDSVVELLAEWVLVDRQATTKASEEAVIEKIRPLLVDDKQNWDEDLSFCGNCDFVPTDDTKHCICWYRNELKADLRKALNLDQEGK